MIYALKNAKIDKKRNWIHHEIQGYPDQIYRDIRIGLSWPEEDAPAYFCLIAQRHRENEYKRFPLVFLHESNADHGHSILSDLVDICHMTLCKEVYTDMSDSKKFFRDIFNEHMSDNNIRNIYLKRAPWADDFNYCMGLIRQWFDKKSLEIDKLSLLANQVSRVPKDIKAFSQKPELDFFAVNALRYVVSSYQKYFAAQEEMKDINYGDPEKYAGYYPGGL